VYARREHRPGPDRQRLDVKETCDRAERNPRDKVVRPGAALDLARRSFGGFLRLTRRPSVTSARLTEVSISYALQHDRTTGAREPDPSIDQVRSDRIVRSSSADGRAPRQAHGTRYTCTVLLSDLQVLPSQCSQGVHDGGHHVHHAAHHPREGTVCEPPIPRAPSPPSSLEGLASLRVSRVFARVYVCTPRASLSLCVHGRRDTRACVRCLRVCVCVCMCVRVRWLGACVWVELDRGRHPSDRVGPTNRGVGYSLPLSLSLSLSFPRPRLPSPASHTSRLSSGSSRPCSPRNNVQ